MGHPPPRTIAGHAGPGYRGLTTVEGVPSRAHPRGRWRLGAPPPRRRDAHRRGLPRLGRHRPRHPTRRRPRRRPRLDRAGPHGQRPGPGHGLHRAAALRPHDRRPPSSSAARTPSASPTSPVAARPGAASSSRSPSTSTSSSGWSARGWPAASRPDRPP